MAEFEISRSLKLPDEAITETLAILAQKGFGKTYTAMKLAEQMYKAGGTVVVLDPVGVWWGLRLAEDGKTKWSDIPIFGGMNGDIIPLQPDKGAFIADVIVDHMTSAVLDVSLMSESEKKRFVADFATQLKFRKAAARDSVLHLFLEEAQEFIPQKPLPDDQRMLGALVKIAKLGRNWGIGLTMISQRPQAVNKEALNLASMLIVGCMIAKLDRKAIVDWIEELGKKEEAKDHLAQMPKLKKGEMIVWSPSWLNLLDIVNISKKETFDVSSTPRLGRKSARLEMKPIDIHALAKAMEETLKQAEENDPKVLKKRMAKLEEEKAALLTRVNERPAVDPKVIDLLRFMQKAVGDLQKGTEVMIQNLQTALDHMPPPRGRASVEESAVPKKIQLRSPNVKKPPHRSSREVIGAEVDKARIKKAANGKVDLVGKSTDMLVALVRHPEGWTREQLAILVGMKQGGGFNNYLGLLNKHQFIQTEYGVVKATDLGCAYANKHLGAVKAGPSTPAEYLELWISTKRFVGKSVDMLRTLAANPEAEYTKEEMAKQVGMAVGGGFNNYVGVLRAAGCLDPSVRGKLKANPEMFA